jgi:hypothetical protein
VAQRRGQRIAFAPEELDEFLTQQRVCRVATMSPKGPHNTPLWFVWDGTALWLNSLVRSQRWTDMQRDPRVSVVVDDGVEFIELRGAELRGTVEPVGEAPRTGLPEPALEIPERLFAGKYAGTTELAHDGHHGWLRLTPDSVTSWDFRKRFAPQA